MKRAEMTYVLEDAVELRMSDLRLIRDVLLGTPDEIKALGEDKHQRLEEIADELDDKAAERFAAVVFMPDEASDG